MSRFDADYYSRFRPFYPSELFSELGPTLETRGFEPPFEIADIGCGTGHSSASLLASGLPARMTGVDPDAAMLAQARAICPQARYWVGSGENTGLADRSCDAIVVGSAFHWMDPLQAREEFLRVLRPFGLIHVYEYQFPKARSHAALNEWIRREFNLRWKAPGQRPRGSFESVTGCFRSDRRFVVLSDRRVPMELRLGPDEVTGLLLSQSRVLHYEATLSERAREEFRARLAQELRGRLGDAGDLFEFNLASSLFASAG